ncbi:MAG: hypothetical protein BV457_08245 [Thermoplasmata archaeon M9B1D]|nr:MAG: hypothetical protein BV457_08245 [Thermoplasmata archaeon M9B1D]PNX50989.1 MAG: hypothetical protein BV456_04795 [Thermoplasmata archaeon M8B2D]
MKKLLVMAVILTAVANAGMWSVISTSDMQKITPEAAYKLNTAGWAPRVYEFTTHTAPIQKCIVLFSSSNENSSPTMVCTKVK